MHQENHQVLHYATLSLVFFTLLSGFVLSQHTFVSATDPSATATATVHVAEACTLSANNTSSHNAEMSNGTYEEGIGSTTFTVKCNDASGFALYAIGYSNEEYGNTNMIGDSTALTIPTGTETVLGNTSSHWSMKVTKDTTSYTPANLTINNSFDSYHVVPDTYTKVATYTTGTDGVNGTGSSVIATYDARVSATQAADSYVGKVKFTLVHPSAAPRPAVALNPLTSSDCPAGWVCYAPNYDDIVGSMDSISDTKITSSPQAGKINLGTSATTINLIAPNYKRDGYGFAGWSTSFDATAETNPVVYGPNETLTVPSTTLATNGMILYPVWVASSGTLQEFSCASSSLTPASYNAETGKVSATLSSITALTDSRDENTYAVARLADGQCWMVENLRLNNEDTTSAEDIALAQGYGNATTSINASGYNLGEFVGLAASEDANFTNSTTANSLYSIDGSNGTTNIYNGYNAGYRLPRYNKNNTNMTLNATNSDGTTTLTDSYNASNNHVRWYGYGNYYNWPAAMANTEYYTTYSGTNGSDAAGTSICPTGWHLPLGYQSSGTLENGSSDAANRVGGFSYLDRVMGGTGANSSTNSVTNASNSANWRAFPNNFVYSGFWNGAQAYGRSSYGYYWSSSASDNNYAYRLYLYSSSVYPGTDNGYKRNGFTVRCVAGS